MLLDAAFLAGVVRRHFEPLLDAAFESVLRRPYPHGVRFEINGQPLPPPPGARVRYRCRLDSTWPHEDLADDFPLLRSLVDRRSGGQKRLPMPGRGRDLVDAPLFALVAAADDAETEPRQPTPPASPEPEAPPPDDVNRTADPDDVPANIPSAAYHTALTVALALSPLAADRADEHAFVTTFLAQWGAARTRP